MTEIVKTTRPINWEFQTLAYEGVCRLARTPRLSRRYLAWMGQRSSPTFAKWKTGSGKLSRGGEWTAEELAVAATKYWDMDVRLEMEAVSHGPITVVSLR